MMRLKPFPAIAGALLLGAAGLTGCASVEREYEAALLLSDLEAEPDAETRLQRRGGDPESETVRYDLGAGERRADLYRPEGEALGNLVLVHGLTEDGKDDERLVAFAESLSRTGYRVLVPDVESLRESRWDPDAGEDVADALRHMAERPESRGKPLKVATFSLMSGPVLLAVRDEELQRRVDSVALIGGYYDLQAWLQYLTTGYDPLAETQDQPAPLAQGRWVLLRTLAEHMEAQEDRRWLRRLADRRIQDPEADISAERASLSEAGQSVVALLENEEPEAFEERYGALPESMRDKLDRLDPSSQRWRNFPPQVLLVHGSNDPVVPASHSRALESALPDARVRESSGLAHVELDAGLLDTYRIWRAASDLLDRRLVPGEPLAVDRDRQVYIPPRDELQRTLQVGAVYNDDAIQIRYVLKTDEPSWYHQYWVYDERRRHQEGRWELYGSGGPPPDPRGLYEDRIAMLIDANELGLREYGGFLIAHEGVRGFPSAADPEEVVSHPHLGERLGREDVDPYLPQSRRDTQNAAWDDVRARDELEALRDAGDFLDLWEWRAHRSHPVGHADSGSILEARHPASGRGTDTLNWDEEAEQPAYMYDPDAAGFRALSLDGLERGDYGQDDPYYLTEAAAKPFDPEHDWESGDALPQRLLREPEGNRSAIRSTGGYSDGAWRIRLTRSLEAPDSRESHDLRPGRTYDVAFSVHEGVGSRWHRVSLPLTLGLEDPDGGQAAGDADLTARYTDGDLDEAEAAWTEVTLIYPGPLTWQWLQRSAGDGHPRGPLVEDEGSRLGAVHSAQQLQDYILFEELRRLREQRE